MTNVFVWTIGDMIGVALLLLGLTGICFVWLSYYIGLYWKKFKKLLQKDNKVS